MILLALPGMTFRHPYTRCRRFASLKPLFTGTKHKMSWKQVHSP
jgi:hypothetical protein